MKTSSTHDKARNMVRSASTVFVSDRILRAKACAFWSQSESDCIAQITMGAV